MLLTAFLLFAEPTSELTSTRYKKHKYLLRNVAFIIHWVVLLALTRVAAVLALMQTDQTIVTTAVAEGLLQEQESWGEMVVFTSQHITDEMIVTTPDPTTITMLGSACAAMGTVIGILWKQTQRHLLRIENKLDDTEQKLVECESDRLKIWQRLAEQSGKKISEIKGEK